MNRSRSALVGLAGALLVLWSVAIRWEVAAGVERAQYSDPPTGAVLVDLDDDADAGDRARIAALLGAAIAPLAWPSDPGLALGEELSEAAQLYRIEAPAAEVGDVLRDLAADEDVEGVELERIWRLPAQQAVPIDEATRAEGPGAERGGPYRPNDPLYRYQWHLDQIQMPAAWARNKGRGVVVAIVDTGIAHRDRGRFRRAPDLARDRFVPGYDFVDKDAHPDDENGHGTHVAGTIAQSTNNGLGVAGVAPLARIMPIRVLDGRGAGSWGSVAAGIRWAADHGADVINLSLGGGTPSSAIRRAIVHAHRKGVVVIAAAGNTGRGRVQYPAAHQHVIAVGAVRFDETLSFYSSFGRHLDLVAPGGDLRVDQNGDGQPDGVLQNTILARDPSKTDYLSLQGTSMASPHVAGVAALLRGAGVRDPATIEAILKRSARGKGDSTRYGAGLVQADAALRAARQGLAGLRGLLALLLGGVLLFGLRRRERLDLRRGPSLALALLLSGGLAALPWHWLGAASGPMILLLGGPLVAAEGWTALLVLTALPTILVASLLLGRRWGRTLVFGVGVGSAAFLVAEAIAPSAGLPALGSWIGPWLLLHAGIATAIAHLASRQR
ncbi:MAG: S8 family peptidase [Myxococcales bacterium]|nr:S8 family peptidase [Myxococcales bacterium]